MVNRVLIEGYTIGKNNISNMVSFREAQTILQQLACSFGQETIALEKALGRVLSEPLVADRDYPPFNRSAMDGIAIRYNDFEKGLRRFEIIETVYAGSVTEKELQAGQCFKIMTGAAVPSNANVVIRREDTREGDKDVEILLDNCRPFQNIALKGEDIIKGVEVVNNPCICNPALIGLLATLGKSKIIVERLPNVALLTTGNEVVPVNAAVNAVQIRNSNRWMLQALLQKWNIEPSYCEHIPDDKNALRQSLQNALGNDVIIMSGGVSAGDADYVPGVLAELGVKKLFHKVAIKPGKPLWCGKLPSGAMVFALPGNPFSGLVTFTLFVQHYLRSCFGVPQLLPFYLPMQTDKRKKASLDEFFPVQFSGQPSKAQPVVINGSGDIRLGLQAQALALHPAESSDLVAGDLVACFALA